MANILKIRNVYLYTAMCDNAQDCWEALKLLKENNIPFVQLNYQDDSNFFTENGTMTNLSTWKFSSDGITSFKKSFTKFPILHWDVLTEDYEKYKNCAEGLDEIKTCDLILNKDKIVPIETTEPEPEITPEQREEQKRLFKQSLINKYKGSLSDDFATLFADETISDELRAKIETVFEASLTSRVENIVVDVFGGLV